MWARILPPVRGAISLRRATVAAGNAALASLCGNYGLHLYASGTDALAVALREARRRHGAQRPQAIVPAYGCPQLVSACLYAGVYPRLVDTAPGQWGYSLDALKAALSLDTVAIVAVNLLGLGDQASDLLPLARASGSLLIQDSAQYLPAKPSGHWCGDYVVLSFGRGKPLNLLRGGALGVPPHGPPLQGITTLGGFSQRCKEAFLGSRAAGALFNFMTLPSIYGIVARLPGLGLGETSFAPLPQVTALPENAWRQVGPACELYARRPNPPWSVLAEEWERAGVRPLARPNSPDLLRLPLLAAGRSQRDALVAACNAQGLGASVMYGVSLEQVANIPSEVRTQGPFPNASEFADRLFTLPTHRFVTEEMVARVRQCLRVRA